MLNASSLLFRRFAAGSLVSLAILSIPFLLTAQTSTDGVMADDVVELAPKVIQENVYKDTVPMVELFDLRKERQVDLLFVIDNSRSMREEQQVLARSFAEYIDQFTRRNLDFQIGVILMEAGGGKLIAPRKSQHPFLTRNTPELEQEFKRLTKRGTGGTKAETAFLPIIAALSNPSNEGFFRAESLLSIVVISDEDESIGGRNTKYLRDYPEQYTSRLFDLKTALFNAKMGKRGLVRLDVVTSPDPIPTDCVTRIAGVGLSRAARELGGNTISICEDFSAPLIANGDEISQVAQRRFSLKQLPFVGSIEVKMNDLPVANDEHNGWTLDFDANAIDLHGKALEQSFGSVITIGYRWLPESKEPQSVESAPTGSE